MWILFYFYFLRDKEMATLTVTVLCFILYIMIFVFRNQFISVFSVIEKLRKQTNKKALEFSPLARS